MPSFPFASTEGLQNEAAGRFSGNLASCRWFRIRTRCGGGAGEAGRLGRASSGNTTGISILASELNGKRQELLLEESGLAVNQAAEGGLWTTVVLNHSSGISSSPLNRRRSSPASPQTSARGVPRLPATTLPVRLAWAPRGLARPTISRRSAGVLETDLGIALDQRSDQVQKRLMLGISLPAAQKRGDVHFRHVTARWNIRFVPDKRGSSSGIAAEKPLIAVRAAIKLFPLRGH